MSDSNYRIKYKKGDFEIEVQGDKAWVENKFDVLRKETPPKTIPQENSFAPTSAPATGEQTLPGTLVEFTRIKNPSQYTDRIVIFAYWLFKKEKMSSYNSSDIENCYNETRITKPANISDMMNKIQGQGLITPVKEEKDGKKAWVITDTGEKYVEQMKQ